MNQAERLRAQQHEYAQLRELAYDRNRRLQAAGFEGYNAPRIRDLTPEQLGREKAKLERWLNSTKGTVRGARKLEAERQERLEAQRERKREYNRQYRERKRQENPPKSRPPRMSDEERRRRHNEANRQYRQRVKARRQEEHLQKWINQQGREAQNYRNLLSGLRKYGIQVNSPEELKAWMRYITERKKDSDNNKYLFDQFLDEAMNALNGGWENANVSADKIFGMVDDFENWRENQSNLEAEFNSPKEAGDYSSADLFSAFLNSGMWERTHDIRGI